MQSCATKDNALGCRWRLVVAQFDEVSLVQGAKQCTECRELAWCVPSVLRLAVIGDHSGRDLMAGVSLADMTEKTLRERRTN